MSILKAMLCASMGLGTVFHNTVTQARDDNDSEPLGLIELDESLEDVEKPIELPAGVYTGEVQDVQVKSSQAGNRYFAIKFVIPQDEISADIREDFDDGAVLYWNRNIVPKPNDRRAKYNLKVLLTALGLPTNVAEIDPNDWMGCRARLRVVMGKYQGEDRAEIRALEAAERAPTAARGKTKGRAAPQEEDGEEEEAPTPRGGRQKQRAGARGARA